MASPLAVRVYGRSRGRSQIQTPATGLSKSLSEGVRVGDSASATVGTQLFVATTGNNTTGTGTFGNPWQTIAKGIAELVALGVGSGATLWIRGGTYSEGIDSNNYTLPTGTSWSDAPIVSAYPSETVTIQQMNLAAPSGAGQGTIQYVIFKGLTVVSSGSDVISFWHRVHHVRVEDCSVTGALGSHVGVNMQPEAIPHAGPDLSFNECVRVTSFNNGDTSEGGGSGQVGHGFYIGATDCLFDGCVAYGNGNHGIQLYSAIITPARNTVRNCVFHDNGTIVPYSVGIVMYGDDEVAYNNVIYDERADGFYVTGSGALLYHNTIYSCTGTGITNTSGSTVGRNNIVYANGSTIAAGGGTFDHNITTDPSFVDGTGPSYDFHLQSGSGARNQGVDLLATVPTDRDGVARDAAPDCGAYEYV